MTDAAGLRALAERVERAEGADRDLDGAVASVVLPNVESYDGDWWWGPHDDAPLHVPAYTASLDDAVSLVPEGKVWCLFGVGYGNNPRSEAYVEDDDADYPGGAATPALALTAAALRARAAMMEGKR